MSLAPKIDEARDVVLDFKPDVGFFLELGSGIQSATTMSISLVTTSFQETEPQTFTAGLASILTTLFN